MTNTPSLGILTGISYVSGIDYFAGINKAFIDRAPKGKVMVPNPSIVMASLDCDQYVHLLSARDFQGVDEYLLAGVARLVAAGCDSLVIASNTGHICIPAVHKRYANLNVLHIADCCAAELLDHGHRKIALLGTKPTMEERYLRDRLAEHGIEVIVPAKEGDRERIYNIICQELSYNIQREDSRAYLVRTIRDLAAQGANGCLLACTEIELLVQQQHVPEVPLYPSARIHIAAAATLLLNSSSTN